MGECDVRHLERSAKTFAFCTLAHLVASETLLVCGSYQISQSEGTLSDVGYGVLGALALSYMRVATMIEAESWGKRQDFDARARRYRTEKHQNKPTISQPLLTIDSAAQRRSVTREPAYVGALDAQDSFLQPFGIRLEPVVPRARQVGYQHLAEVDRGNDNLKRRREFSFRRVYPFSRY